MKVSRFFAFLLVNMASETHMWLRLSVEPAFVAVPGINDEDGAIVKEMIRELAEALYFKEANIEAGEPKWILKVVVG